jgi:hypothetical protein
MYVPYICSYKDVGLAFTAFNTLNNRLVVVAYSCFGDMFLVPCVMVATLLCYFLNSCSMCVCERERE